MAMSEKAKEVIAKETTEMANRHQGEIASSGIPEHEQLLLRVVIPLCSSISSEAAILLNRILLEMIKTRTELNDRFKEVDEKP